MGINQPAIALHEHQPGIASAGRNLIDIRAQNRRQISIDNRGIAAPDNLDQRRDAVADRYLCEPDLFGNHCQPFFVGRKTVRMHEHDGDRAVTLIIGLLQSLARLVLSQRAFDRAIGAHPLIDLDRAGIELFGQNDVAGENVGPVLVADPQTIGEPACDGQKGGRAFALEQRVGRDRGAHLDRINRAAGQGVIGLQPHNFLDAENRSIVITFRVF